MRSFWIYYNSNNIGSDFKVDEFGWYYSPPAYEFKEVRVNYILHFVKKGTCRFTIWDKQTETTVTVGENEAICVFPGYEHKYRADDTAGCVRYWLSFSGSACDNVLGKCNITSQYLTIKGINTAIVEKEIRGLYGKIQNGNDPTFVIHAATYNILAHIENVNTTRDTETPKTEKGILIESVSNYVDSNLSTVTVKDLSGRFGYEESYLYRIFRQERGMSVQNFIVMKKINRAKSLLSTTDLKMDEVAEQVGYTDYISFARIFKSHVGITPAQYRSDFKQNYKKEGKKSEH